MFGKAKCSREGKRLETIQLVFRVTRQRMTEALFHVTWRAPLSSYRLLLFHHKAVSLALVQGKADEIARQPKRVFPL